jgi:hypothetical protein
MQQAPPTQQSLADKTALPVLTNAVTARINNRYFI